MASPPALVVALPALDDVLAGRLACPAGLRRILERAQDRPGGGDEGLARALGLDDIPAAGPRTALAANGATEAGTHWLRIDPVHLQPDLTAVWLRAPAALDWSAASMAPLNDALEALFDAPDLAWCAPGPDHTGHLRLDESPRADFTPLHAAVGARLDEILPRGPGAARWHGLINESQMTFHQFRALDDPNPAGLGLWFWGGGTLPVSPAAHPVRRIVALGDSDQGRGLARWLGLEVEPAGSGFSPAAGTTLVEASLGADTLERLPGLDAEWFEPAWRALRAGRLKSLQIVGHARQVTAGRWTPMAFWRRRRPEVGE